jgi:hypothetical protein
MIWFFHSGGTETSLSSADRASADSAPVNISAAARRKIPSNRGLRILQPKLNDDVHTTAHVAAGDVRARYSLAGETRAYSLRYADQIDGGCGDTRSVAAILANTPVKRRPTIASALDGRSRTDALAGWCVQLRQHLPRGPRCQPRPQPPAAATTWLVSSAAFAMAAPLAALASAFDAPSAPTPTATMAAASNARIWLLLFWADTLDRTTD